ncbi:DUF4242 domain-containing protein [Pleurocapsales cyanobacterium LEGE 06147]|nr:DUF4242 domain-containing protein [Pleurocapsales cyanobacterium LEGE 06147]
MSLVIVETTTEQSITPEVLKEVDARMLPCLEERNTKWRYSLLSSDRHRMICTFDAPDAESVRQAYRKGGGMYSRIWAGEIVAPEGIQPQQNETILKVFEGTYPDGFTEEDWNEANQYILPCYAERGIEWVRSYISLDRTRVICELNAPDAETIREAHLKFGIPFVREACLQQRVWSAMLIEP